jgi:tRNA uridine 5-carbamoylmethylation protein Kti12
MAAGRIVIVTGPPGSGKTTVSALLAAGFDRAVHLESDELFHAIRSGYVKPWKPESHEQNDTVMRVVRDAAITFGEAGYLTVVDGILLPGWYFEWLTEELLRQGLEVSAAILQAPLDVCVVRAGRRAVEDLDPAAIEKIWHGFAVLGPLERHVVDMHHRTPEAAARVVAERLERGALTVTV